MYWRDTGWNTWRYPGCEPIELSPGLLFSRYPDLKAELIESSVFQQTCYKGNIPMLNTNKGILISPDLTTLPIIQESWRAFTKDGDRGAFSYSVVSIIYSISILAVITWFLNLFVFTNYSLKPSFLLKVSTVLSSVYLLFATIRSIVELHSQQLRGYLHGQELLDVLRGSLALNILDLIVVFLLQISHVQVIMRIFLRQQDKRLTVIVGVLASIASQVIWAITKFYNFPDDSEAADILPAFTYLVRITMSTCYAVLFTAFHLNKIHYILSNKSIWLLTILTLIMCYSPVAFFIADVSNAWVYDLSEIFSIVTYDLCVVLPWAWCNKFNGIMKAKEKEGVLGRRFYEDELYGLDRLELFVEEYEDENCDHNLNSSGRNNDNDNDNDNNNDNFNNSGNGNGKGIETNTQGALGKLEGNVKKVKTVFLNLTDNVIAKGLAIPRSTSATSSESEHREHRQRNTRVNNIMDSIKRDLPNEPHQDRNQGTDGYDTGIISGTSNSHTTSNSQVRNRRDVFVYNRKEMVINFTEED